jgi:hypothetical protein
VTLDFGSPYNDKFSGSKSSDRFIGTSATTVSNQQKGHTLSPASLITFFVVNERNAANLFLPKMNGFINGRDLLTRNK